jgi:hypothetical protein
MWPARYNVLVYLAVLLLNVRTEFEPFSITQAARASAYLAAVDELAFL